MKLFWPRAWLVALVLLSTQIVYRDVLGNDSGMPENRLADVNRLSDSGKKITLLQAVRIAIENSPIILQAEQKLEAAAGALTSAGGHFNTTAKASTGYLSSKTPKVYGGVTTDGNQLLTSQFTQLDTQLGVSKLFRSGVQVTPSVGVSQFNTNADNLMGNATTGTFKLTVDVPLLRGLGERATAAHEIAASHSLDQANYELWRVISDELRKTVVAYWKYVASIQSRDVFLQARDRNQSLLRDGELMVEASQIPASDLTNYEASLAQSEAALADAEARVVTSRYELGMLMGVATEKLSLIPDPLDRFYEPQESNVLSSENNKKNMLQYAVDHRPDLLALDQKILATGALLGRAESELLPLLNVKLEAGYQGLTTTTNVSDLVSALGKNVPGFVGGASVNFELPFANEKAIGQVKQVNASLTEAQIEKENLVRAVVSEVNVAVTNVSQAFKALKYARTATNSRQRAFDTERKKLAVGLSTVIELGVVANNLTTSQIDYIKAELEQAQSTIAYRHATATLFVQGNETKDLDTKRLTTLPDSQENDMSFR